MINRPGLFILKLEFSGFQDSSGAGDPPQSLPGGGGISISCDICIHKDSKNPCFKIRVFFKLVN